MKNAVIVAVGTVVFLAASGAPKGDGAPKQAPTAQAQVKELRAEIKKLQGLAPDQAAVMSHLGYHWSNLWFAIEQENWARADFYLSPDLIEQKVKELLARLSARHHQRGSREERPPFALGSRHP